MPIIAPNDLAVQQVLCRLFPCSFVCVTTIESDATSAKQMQSDARVRPVPKCGPKFAIVARNIPAENAPMDTHSLLPHLSEIKPYIGLNAHGKLTVDQVMARSDAVNLYTFTSSNCTDRDIKANENPYTVYAKYRVCIVD